MILKLSEKELARCKEFLDVKEMNLSSAEIYIEYLAYHCREIKKFDIEKLSKKYPENEVFFQAFLHALKIEKNDAEFNEINDVCNIKDIKELNSEEFKKDQFYRKFSPISLQKNDWIFTKLNYAPFEGFVYDELDVNPDTYAEHTPLGYFKEEFPYFAVIQKEDIWMSVIPHEINTMKECFKNTTSTTFI